MNLLHIVSIICFALCLLMFFYLRWYIKKQTLGIDTSKGGLKERQNEVARLIAEIDRITDRDSQLVEERIITLKAIIEEADKRISVYIKELERSRSGETLYASLRGGIRDALSNPEDFSQLPDDGQTYPEDTIEISQPRSSHSTAPSIPVNTARSYVPLSETPEISMQQETGLPDSPPPNKQQLRSHIDILLDEGIGAEEIASRLGISAAEVNLAINLRRKN